MLHSGQVRAVPAQARRQPLPPASYARVITCQLESGLRVTVDVWSLLHITGRLPEQNSGGNDDRDYQS
jgi:hypothetical protein